MKILSKAIYGFNAILTKITIFFFRNRKTQVGKQKKAHFPKHVTPAWVPSRKAENILRVAST